MFFLLSAFLQIDDDEAALKEKKRRTGRGGEGGGKREMGKNEQKRADINFKFKLISKWIKIEVKKECWSRRIGKDLSMHENAF